MKKLSSKQQKKGILIILSIMLVLVAIIGGWQAYHRLKSNKATETRTVVEELDTYNDFYNNTESLNKQNSIIIASKDVTDYQGADSVYTLGDMTYLTYSSEEQAENALNIYKENGYTAEKDVITEFNLEELDETEEKIISESTTSENGKVYTDSELESLSYNPITVAVLDSGINPDDEIKDRVVFKKRISYENGDSEISTTWLPYEWGGQSRQFEDSRNHGTQIAKIIAENTNANVQIASYNVIDDNNKIYTSALVSAIYDCIAKDVKVINMSLTTRGYSEILEYAIKDAMEHGIIVVAAAGNYGEDASGYTPANISGVITVGASDENGNITDYSNYGEDVDCIADGNVYSEEGEIILKGTSFSAARVSAYAARIVYGRSTGYIKYILDYIKEQTGNNITYENITKALNNVGLLEKINTELLNKDYETIVNSTDYKQMIKDKFEKEMTFSLQLRGNSEHWAGPFIEGHGQTMSWGPYVKHASDPGFRYGFTIDRSNDYYNKNDWYFNSAAEVLGHPVKDVTGSNHTVCHNAWVHPTKDRSADDSSVCNVSKDHVDVRPSWSALWNGGFFRACQVGVTYKIGVGDPGNPSGYTFAGWSVSGGDSYTSADSGYKYAHVGAYGDNVDYYETWNCNHSYWGRNENYTGYGECSGSCGYYTCKNCEANLGTWDTRVNHDWQLKGNDNASQHWYQCSHNSNHTKDRANHIYNSTPSVSDNYYNYYDCTVCRHRKSEPRYYTISYYVRNENADGSWGGYWHWYSQNYTYGQTWSYSGYTNDATYKPISGSGTVTGNQNVYIDAYRNRHSVNYYVRNQNPDGTWGGYWHWYSESKRYGEPYSALGYSGDINYKQVSTSGTMYSNDITEYMDAYRQLRNMDFNVYVSEDGSNSNYDTHYNTYGDSRLIWNIKTNGGDSNYNSNNVLDWRKDVRTQSTFDIEAKIVSPGYHIEKIELRDNVGYGYSPIVTSHSWVPVSSTIKNEVQKQNVAFTLHETWHNQEVLAYIKPNIYYYNFNLNKPLKATSEPEIIGADTIPVCYNNSVVTSASEVTTIHSFPTAKLHGWQFIGWNTKADGTGERYTADKVFNRQTSDLNLYAQWEQTQYTVRLSADVGSTGHNLGENLSDKLDNTTQQKISLSTNQDSNNNLTLGNITWKYHEDGNNSYYEAVLTYDEPQSIYDYDAYFHLDYFVGNGWYYNGNKINGISQSENNTIKTKFNLIDLVNSGNNYLAGPDKNIITLIPLYKINDIKSIDTRNSQSNIESIDYYRRFYTGQTVTYDMLMLMNTNKNRSEDDFRLINSFTTLNLSDLTSYPITKTESAKTSGNTGNTQKVNPISVTDDFSTDYMRDNLEIEKLIFKDINGNSISSISGVDLRNNAKSGIKVPDNARSYEVIFTATDDGWVEVDSDWNSRYDSDYVAMYGYMPNDMNGVYKKTEPRTIRASYTGTILQNNAPTLKETPVRIYKEQIESWTTLNDVNKEIEELKATILKYQVVSDFEDNNDKLSNWYKSEIQSQKLRNSMAITDIHKGTRKEAGSIDYTSGSSLGLKEIINNIHDIKDNQYYEVTITIKDSFDKETKSKVHLYVIYNPADFDVDESNNINRIVYMPTNITGNYTLSDSIISHNLQGTSKEGLLNSSYSKVDGTPARTEDYEFNSGSIYGNKGSVKIIEY